MAYKIPRGQVRKLILGIGDIQDAISSALASVHDDRSMGAFTRVVDGLEEALQICIDLRGEYAPVERKEKDE